MTGHPRRFTRRSINALVAGAAAWPCCQAGAQLMLAEPNLPLQHALVSLFEDPRSACAIGVACLKSLPPAGNSPDGLASAISSTAGCNSETLTSRHATRRRIRDRVRSDFAEGAVLNVDGWILSVTEARLYALAALSAAQNTA